MTPPLNVNGWVIINKPVCMTSAAVVGKVKRLLKCKKVGHAGTLDPLASGVLPLAVGEATKVVSYAVQDQKAYRFTVRWGSATTTDDQEGEVVAESDCRPKKEDIVAALPQFIGDIEQVPPLYSAIKVQGKRAYNLARDGVEFELPARLIQVYSLKLESSTEDTASFYVECGKGTYVRSLARDIAHYLGTEGHIILLERVKVGRFSKNDAILLEKLEETVYKEGPSEWLKPLETVLDDIPVLILNSEEARVIRHGQRLQRSESLDEGAIVLLFKDEPVALAKIIEGRIKPIRVFNL